VLHWHRLVIAVPQLAALGMAVLAVIAIAYIRRLPETSPGPPVQPVRTTPARARPRRA
jgi:hypothetical protein